MFRYGRDSANVWCPRRNWQLNSKPNLLIHSDTTNGSTTFVDSGATGHTITAHGDVQHATAQKKFLGSSILFDGTGDYLSAPDHADWDVIKTTTDKWTIDFWIRHAGLTGYQGYIDQRENVDNDWALYYDPVNKCVNFMAEKNGPTSIAIQGTSDTVDTINKWYHIAFCKVLTELGIYTNGVQTGYGQQEYWDNDTLSGILRIGMQTWWPSTYYFNGYMDEIRIANYNTFGASPNSDKTDTIVVPFRTYISWS